MSDVPDPHARLDAARAAAEALSDTKNPDAKTLAAVHDGLRSVVAGAPTSWFDVPTQRSRLRRTTLTRRRTH